MRRWWSAPLSALPIFLLGCVCVLFVCQIRLANLQAVTAGYGWPAAARPHSSGAVPVSADSPGSLQLQQQLLQANAHQPITEPSPVVRDTLVLYVYNEDDPVFKDNFNYFLLAGVQQHSRCAYVVLVQLKSLKSAEQLPELPSVQYLYYAGKCLEWGIVGWALQSEHLDVSQYSYFMFMSSAVRGPFMPTYLEGRMHWTQPFISRLTDTVKLVGPSISCTPVPSDPHNLSAPWDNSPHIPLHAVATDKVGLEVLQRAGVLGCHTTVWEEKYASEVRAASALLEAGYGIDCLLIRYQGVDWSQSSAHGCNRAWDPTGPGDFVYDGIALEPLEAMFVRVNNPMLQQRVPSALRAIKYTEWALAVASEAAGLLDDNSARVAGNAYVTNKGLYKLPRILSVYVRGQKCFDVEYFVEHNRDFFGKTPYAKIDKEMAWKFFVYVGQFEDRKFRFSCETNYTMVATPAF